MREVPDFQEIYYTHLINLLRCEENNAYLPKARIKSLILVLDGGLHQDQSQKFIILIRRLRLHQFILEQLTFSNTKKSIMHIVIYVHAEFYWFLRTAILPSLVWNS